MPDPNKRTLPKHMNIPYLLIAFRLILAPVVLLLSWNFGKDAAGFVILLMYLGLVSDILDGIIARRLGQSTEKLRRMDSQADLIFWLAIGISCWILYPDVIAENKMFVIALIVMECLCYLTSLIRFGKETSTHAFLAKMWGLTLLAAFTTLLATGTAGFAFYLCVVVGLISQADVILIVLILPRWQHDIPSSYHAWLIRKGRPFKKNRFLNS
jgi:phosphatidylglycerophosphate synthase